MTSLQWISEQKRRIGGFVACVEPAIVATHNEQVQRIFGRGENSLGGKIGEYNSSRKTRIFGKVFPSFS